MPHTESWNAFINELRAYVLGHHHGFDKLTTGFPNKHTNLLSRVKYTRKKMNDGMLEKWKREQFLEVANMRDMDIEHRMPESYLKHKVFDDLKYMMEFYDSISMSCLSFVATGTHGITNYASYVYTAIEGTLDSISILLTKGRINDAYTLIRKLFDDILLEIYMDVILKHEFSVILYN